MKAKQACKIVVAIVVFLLANSGVVAQDATRIVHESNDPAKQSFDEPARELHITNVLNETPAARQALRDFHRARAAGKLQSSTARTDLTLGSRATFRVLTNVITNATWEEKDFELKASNDIAAIWVEETQLNLNNVTDSDITALEEALLNATPAGSIDPSRGIVAINNTYFGAPPDVDGDGRLDILLYDIEEGLDNSNSFVAGFVTTQDLSPSGGGNNKDILYLDTDPGLKNRPVTSVLSTAAHEYQHLIHFNYDTFEIVFANEGLSEWAEVLNGYPARTMSFLKDSGTYNVRLFGWETGDDILDDYRRASLFTGYLAERASPEAVASLTRNPARARAAYEEMLTQEGLDFETMVMDYHTANLLNGSNVDARFSYAHSTFSDVRAVATIETDGRATESTPVTETFIEAGSVEYLVWKNVSDFSFSIDAVEAFPTIRSRVRVRAILHGSDGAVRYQDFDLPQTQQTFAGSYDEVTLMLVHVKPELTSRVGVTYDAVWTNSTQGTITGIAYDDGQVASETFFSLSAGANGAVATRFELPAPNQSRLLEVYLSPYFLNQFSGTTLPNDSPRDLTLTIWSENADGAPGDVLFSRVVQDPRPFTNADIALEHFAVSLDEFAFTLSRLPNVIYVGYTEAGADENYMVIGPSTYASADISYVTRRNGDWGSLWQTQFSNSDENDFPLNGMVIPIRTVFEVLPQPVSSEETADVPLEAALMQNYPNPFSGSSMIEYTIPRAGDAEIAVYDLLGRRVHTLVDRFHEAGRHSVTFDAGALPSGAYVYTLKTGPQTLTRRMIVIR